jgi:hypothetical protein
LVPTVGFGVGMMLIVSFFEQPIIQKIPAKRVKVMNDCKRIGGHFGFQIVDIHTRTTNGFNGLKLFMLFNIFFENVYI